MSQKTFKDILHQQTRNAMEWLSQKVPGTENCSPMDILQDALVEAISSEQEKTYKSYDDTINGYHLAGPEGNGTYIDGVRIDYNKKN